MLLNTALTIRRSGFKPDAVIGISRGGWIPARILTDLLGDPILADVKAEFYVGIAETKTKPVLTRPATVEIADLRVLIADEVADTGKSLSLDKNYILQQGASEARTATLYRKPWNAAPPDYWERETSRWVVFPWEIRETVQKILEKCAQSRHPAEPEIRRLVNAGVPSRLAARFMKEIIEEDKLAKTR